MEWYLHGELVPTRAKRDSMINKRSSEREISKLIEIPRKKTQPKGFLLRLIVSINQKTIWF